MITSGARPGRAPPGDCRKRRCKAGVPGNRASTVSPAVPGGGRVPADSPEALGYPAPGDTFLSGGPRPQKASARHSRSANGSRPSESCCCQPIPRSTTQSSCSRPRPAASATLLKDSVPTSTNSPARSPGSARAAPSSTPNLSPNSSAAPNGPTPSMCSRHENARWSGSWPKGNQTPESHIPSG